MAFAYSLPKPSKGTGLGGIEHDMLARIMRAEDALARLDERIAACSFADGFRARQHFHEAAATLWLEGELVHEEELVLHDARMDIRPPSHELTRAHEVLRTRRRIASAPAGWAATREGVNHLARREAATGVKVEAATAISEQDVLARELAEMDVLLERTEQVLQGEVPPGGALRRSSPDPALHDPQWGEGERIARWLEVVERAADEAGAPVLAAALVWDAWEVATPLQNQHWLGLQLAASYLRRANKARSHLPALALGLKTISRERRRSSDRDVRLSALIEAVELYAERGMKELQRLTLAHARIMRKLEGRRTSSSLPALVDLVMARPVVSAALIAGELNVTQRAALNLVAELGLREVTGRGRFRAWGVL